MSYNPQQPYQYPQWQQPPPPKRQNPAMVVLAVIGGTVVGCIAIFTLLNLFGSMRTVTPTAQAVISGTPATTTGPDISGTRIAEMNITAQAGSVPQQQQPQPTQAPQQATQARVGQVVSLNGYMITVNAVDRSAAGFTQFFKPKAGSVFVAVDVTVESGAASGVSVNPFYTSLRDDQGFTYTATFAGKDPALQSQNDLPRGQKMRGWVTFEVGEGAKGLTFIYKPLSFTGNTLIQISLGQ
jgi:hypothetical protein